MARRSKSTGDQPPVPVPGVSPLTVWRDAQGWTQFELAVKSGVSLSSVVNIETNRQIPSMVLARKLAQVFGVGIEDIAWPTPDHLVRRHKPSGDSPKKEAA